MHRKEKKLGQAVIEYILLIALIASTFIIFQKYIARAFSGRWKGVGQSLTGGKYFDPQATYECVYDQRLGVWYPEICFSQSCADLCRSQQNETNPGPCNSCIQTCATFSVINCNQ